MAQAPFSLVNHAMLSSRSKSLVEEELDGNTRLAEYLLGVQSASFAGVAETNILVALALQVNFQLEQGTEAAVYEEMRDGETWSIYQRRTTDARALQMATVLLRTTTTKAFNAIPSLR